MVLKWVSIPLQILTVQWCLSNVLFLSNSCAGEGGDLIKLSCSLYLQFLLLAQALRLKKSSCCSHSPNCTVINLTTNRLDILGVEKNPKSSNLTLHPVFYPGHCSCVRNKIQFVKANGKFIPYGTFFALCINTPFAKQECNILILL